MSNVIKLKANSKRLKVRINDSAVKSIHEEQELEKQRERQQRESEFEKRYQQGFQEGQAAIRQEMEEKFNAQLLERYNEISNTFDSVKENLDEYKDVFAKLVSDLSMMISEKIIRREVEKESMIKDVIKESLNKIIGANNIQIKLNPDELEQIKMESDNMMSDKSLSNINFEADERIDAGGCLVITEIGNVDGRISAQLDEINKQLNAVYSVEEE